MKAVILAAGCSRRLRPHTDFTPKCLLTVAGDPILQRAIQSLLAAQGAKLTELVMVTGYREKQIHAAVHRWFPNLHVTFVSNPDYSSTNNAYSLLLASDAIAGHEFVLLDSDIVFDQGVVDAVWSSDITTCLALRPSTECGAEEVKVEQDARGRVRRIGKDVELPLSAGESIGIERFSAAASGLLFGHLERRVRDEGRVNEYYEASFQDMIEAGTAMHTVDVGGHFCMEIDTPEDLGACEQILLGRQRRVA